MAILKRNKLERYSFNPRTVPVQKTVAEIKFNNIYTGRKVTPYILTKLLEDLHRQKRLKLPRPAYTYTSQAKTLLDKFGEDKSVELLLWSAELSKNPWSFKFVDKLGVDKYGTDEKCS